MKIIIVWTDFFTKNTKKRPVLDQFWTPETLRPVYFIMTQFLDLLMAIAEPSFLDPVLKSIMILLQPPNPLFGLVDLRSVLDVAGLAR